MNSTDSDPFCETELADQTPVTESSGASSSGAKSSKDFSVPRIERFVLLEMLGSGAMGEVILAYDPRLDRRVAIKLIKTSKRASRSLYRRMEREAMAMAKLAHPNVVTVYESGQHEDQFFIVMEFVKGQDLQHWLANNGEQSDWRQVLDIFIQAGRGLDAAHRAGLVHRDFKPGNIFVGEDGRTRVGDFGLACLSQQQKMSEASTGDPIADQTAVSTPDIVVARNIAGIPADEVELICSLTMKGTRLGTPAYMAPEQWETKQADHRSDQFAFCVALWEGLFGQRPHTGKNSTQLALNVTSGTRRPPPPGNTIPQWLVKVIDRGLAVDPANRYPSMAQLLAALENDPTRRRLLLRRLSLGALLLSTVGGVGISWQKFTHSQKVAACDAAGQEIFQSWHDGAKQQIEEAFNTTEKPHAADVFAKMTPWVDRWTEEWAAATTAACMNYTVEEVWGEATYNKSRGCLLDQKEAFDTLIGHFQNADGGVLNRAISAAATLPSLDPCIDEQELKGQPTVDAEEAKIRRQLASIGTYAWTAKYEEGLALAQALADECEEIECGPTRAVARYHVGSFISDLGDQAKAEKELLRAFSESSLPGGNLNVWLTTSSLLIPIVGVHLERPDEAMLWKRVTRAHLDRTQKWHTEHAIGYWANAALLHQRQKQFDEARRLLEQAIEHANKYYGSEHPKTLRLLTNLGNLLSDSGELRAAKAILEQVSWQRAILVGESHPDLARDLYNYAIVLNELGENDEAITHCKRALSIVEKTFGPKHPRVGYILDVLANILTDANKHKEALEYSSKSLEVFRHVFGEDHPEFAITLSNRATTLGELGQTQAAVVTLEQALAILEKQLGSEHVDTTSTLNSLGALLTDLGRLEQAGTYLERATAIRKKYLGIDHPSYALSLFNLAIVKEELGQLELAEAGIRDACTIFAGKLGEKNPKTREARAALVRVLKAQSKYDAGEGLCMVDQSH